MQIWKGLALVGLVVGATGCTVGPRYVATSTASKGQVKFLYVGNKGTTTGIVKCEMAETGELRNCRDVKVVLEEK